MVRSSAGHVMDKSEWGHQSACIVQDKQPQGRLMRCGLVRRMVWNNVGRRHPLRSLAWAASRHRLMMGYAVREIQACAKTQTRGLCRATRQRPVVRSDGSGGISVRSTSIGRVPWRHQHVRDEVGQGFDLSRSRHFRRA